MRQAASTPLRTYKEVELETLEKVKRHELDAISMEKTIIILVIQFDSIYKIYTRRSAC